MAHDPWVPTYYLLQHLKLADVYIESCVFFSVASVEILVHLEGITYVTPKEIQERMGKKKWECQPQIDIFHKFFKVQLLKSRNHHCCNVALYKLR